MTEETGADLGMLLVGRNEIGGGAFGAVNDQ